MHLIIEGSITGANKVLVRVPINLNASIDNIKEKELMKRTKNRNRIEKRHRGFIIAVSKAYLVASVISQICMHDQ